VVLRESPVFIVLYRRAGCVPDPFGKKRLDFHHIFLRLSDGEEMRLVRNVKRIDQKVGLD
jgi:hypothetical protein